MKSPCAKKQSVLEKSAYSCYNVRLMFWSVNCIFADNAIKKLSSNN